MLTTISLRSGFTYEGTKRRAVFSHILGKYVDASYFAVLNTDWIRMSSSMLSQGEDLTLFDALAKRQDFERSLTGYDELSKSAVTETARRSKVEEVLAQPNEDEDDFEDDDDDAEPIDNTEEDEEEYHSYSD